MSKRWLKTAVSGHYTLLLTTIVVASPTKATAITREGLFQEHVMSDLEINAKIAVAAPDSLNPMYLLTGRATFGHRAYN